MDSKCVSLFEDNPWLIIQLQNYLSMTVALASTCYAGYLGSNFVLKWKENFSSTTLYPIITMRRYLRTSIHKSKKIVDIIEQPMTYEYLVFLEIHHL